MLRVVTGQLVDDRAVANFVILFIVCSAVGVLTGRSMHFACHIWRQAAFSDPQGLWELSSVFQMISAFGRRSMARLSDVSSDQYFGRDAR